MDALSSYFTKAEDVRDPNAMPLLARDFSGLPPAVVCTAERDILASDARDYVAALQEAGANDRLILGEALPHTFLGVLRIYEAAARAFEVFAREMNRLLRD